jgi:hypothetical protein
MLLRFLPCSFGALPYQLANCKDICIAPFVDSVPIKLGGVVCCSGVATATADKDFPVVTGLFGNAVGVLIVEDFWRKDLCAAIDRAQWAQVVGRVYIELVLPPLSAYCSSQARHRR